MFNRWNTVNMRSAVLIWFNYFICNLNVYDCSPFFSITHLTKIIQLRGCQIKYSYRELLRYDKYVGRFSLTQIVIFIKEKRWWTTIQFLCWTLKVKSNSTFQINIHDLLTAPVPASIWFTYYRLWKKSVWLQRHSSLQHYDNTEFASITRQHISKMTDLLVL